MSSAQCPSCGRQSSVRVAAYCGYCGARLISVAQRTLRRLGAALFAVLAVVLLVVLVARSGHRPITTSTNPPPAPPGMTTPSSNAPAPGIPSSNTKPTISEPDVHAVLGRWQKAQRERDFAAYAQCYAEDFTGIKRTLSGRAYRYNRDGWLADRRQMMSRAGWLKVDAENISVSLGPGQDEATAEFTQYYRSDRYSDRGPKVMRFHKIGAAALIVYEELKWSSRL